MLRSPGPTQKVDEASLIEDGISEKAPVADATLPSPGLSPRDQRAMALLVVLCASRRWDRTDRIDLLQGIPVGLAFGSIPFLLRARLSYSQIGFFSLASYPYSLKLLWSPIVDACYSTRYGRRKSWIVPVQTIVGLLLWWLANNVPELLERSQPDVRTLSFLFFTLVFFAATQGAHEAYYAL